MCFDGKKHPPLRYSAPETQTECTGKEQVRAISAGSSHTVGLKADGTVIAVGSSNDGQCDVSGWTDIVAIFAGAFHTVGLKTDGTVKATEYTGGSDNYNGQCDVGSWKLW